MSGRLRDRTAIVTGAGRGIGAAIAHRFAEEGARVAIAEIDPETGVGVAATLRERGAEAVAVTTDVADPASVRTMTATVVDELGPPDVLVNNAGIAVFDDPLELTDEDWARCFDVDLNGVWYCCREVLPHMLDAGGGSIVNIASVHSFQIIPGCFPYPVAKHGVLGLTRALAMDYARHGIRVNAICPGYIDTPINAEIWSTAPDPQAEREKAAALHPVGRIGTPDEVAWPAVFLASHESSFMTGASLVVDGGRSVLHHE